MLVALRVKNFILMDELELTLSPGLNVLTGETGAGKSIVVGALSLVLGGRASADVVRPGAAEAEVEALFDFRGETKLPPALGDGAVGGEIAIRRVVQANGRSRAYLNGRLCTAAELSALAPDLADVASQHESVALTDPTTHLAYLDRFATLTDARAELAAEVDELLRVVAELARVREAERGRGEREAFLVFQRDAIDELSPKPGELDDLKAERVRLRSAGRLSEVSRLVVAKLEQGDGGYAGRDASSAALSICDSVARLASELRAASSLDHELVTYADALDGCWSALSDVAREVSRYGERIEDNPDRLAAVEDRLYRLEGLVRKHGPTIEDVLATRARIAVELDALASVESKVEELGRERDERLARAGEHARALSAKRREAAIALGDAISEELADLGMGGARVVVDVAPLDGDRTAHHLSVDGARLSHDGIDHVEFLIAPNKGIDPRPLRRIASGGELSRALLALKRALAEHGPAGLYVFDEVDAGVGGAVAEKIGRAIAGVARHRQVLCVTHLAPIAAFGQAHFVVSKRLTEGTTKSAVVEVTGKDRVAELARMLAGAKVTDAATRAASEMLKAAESAAKSRMGLSRRARVRV